MEREFKFNDAVEVSFLSDVTGEIEWRPARIISTGERNFMASLEGVLNSGISFPWGTERVRARGASTSAPEGSEHAADEDTPDV